MSINEKISNKKTKRCINRPMIACCLAILSISHYRGPLYFGTQIAEDAGISEDRFPSLWRNGT